MDEMSDETWKPGEGFFTGSRGEEEELPDARASGSPGAGRGPRTHKREALEPKSSVFTNFTIPAYGAAGIDSRQPFLILASISAIGPFVNHCLSTKKRI